MIKKFSVKQFKNFNGVCTLDFSKTRDYDFNSGLIKNGLINKALLYGKNGSGKSNLGFAIMDITLHLTDSQRNPWYYAFALNGDASSKTIDFTYEFLFNKRNIIYKYSKNEFLKLLNEEIYVESELVFSYNYLNNQMFNKLEEISNINENVLKNRNINNSIIKTIYGFSAHLPSNSPIKLIFEFVNGMLWFRSLGLYEFMGTTNIIDNVDLYIASSDEKTSTFQLFLKECGLNYNLVAISDVTGKKLYVKFNNNTYPFFSIASTGTKSLSLFFYWLDKTKDSITFLYLDEFDAFYHFKLSQNILRKVISNSSYQSILTTHNPYLADNSIMRPDCYLYIKDGNIKSFADSTNRVIRQGNSLEKMILSDEL